MENEKLERAKQIAKETKDKIDSDAKKAELDKKNAESKGAADDSKKTEGIVETAEKQAEENTRILSSKDEDLSDEDKSKKVELLKSKEKKEDTADDKIKRIKEETQKRIDELISESKAEKAKREQDVELIKKLTTEIESLKKTIQPNAEEEESKKIELLVTKRVSQYLEEDKEKPREKRREMIKEELEEWLLEDYIAATEWLTDRNLRRRDDKYEIKESLREKPRQDAAEFIKKQQESLSKLSAKYPTVIPSSERMAQLRGKSHDEIEAILIAENEDYRMMVEIAKSDPKKYIEQANGPELVMLEMDKRKAEKSGKKTITLTEEELQQKIKEAAEAEVQRLSGIDEGLTSSGGKKVEKKENKTPLRQEQERIAKKAGISNEELDAAIKRRESIPGASFTTAEEFNKE